MTAYQALLAEQARTLSQMVTEMTGGPILPLTVGLKTVLTGEEIALPSEDVAEVERRFRAIKSELQAQGDLEEFFARRVASMTVRVERGVRLESANLSDKVRCAVADFDAGRVAEAARLYDWITADPLVNSRKLHETIEGVDRMIRAFGGLKDDLLRATSRWGWFHLEKVENLMSRRLSDLPTSRAKALSDAVGGDFKLLDEADGAGLEASERQVWARERLTDLINTEVARLEEHRATFDLSEVARERSDSVDRVLFDPSKEASLARKYEAAAERSLYKALRELRQLQKTKAVCRVAEIEESVPGLGSFFPGEVVVEADRRSPIEKPASERSSGPDRRVKGSRRGVRSSSS